MKHLRTYEGFADDLLNQVGGPDKPISRTDLTGPYSYTGLPDLPVIYAVEFIKSGTFGAIHNAESYLKDLGYNIGSMERDNPIGFSARYDRISKWWNMNQDEHRMLDGVIIPNDGDFREGGVLVLFFTEPNF